MSIITNKVKCKKCGDIIESKHRHDLKYCKCGSIAVDGGHDYLRRIGLSEDYIELSEDDEKEFTKVKKKNRRVRNEQEIEEMISKLYSYTNKHPEELTRIILYADCLSWVLGEAYLDEYIKDLQKDNSK